MSLLRQLLPYALFVGCFACTGALRGADAPAGEVPGSISPALEQAAGALAERDLVRARSGFEAVLGDASSPAFVRALAFTGLGETALAGSDYPGALAIWKRQAADPGSSRFHRELAARRSLETERLRNGKPVRVAEEFRESLPSVPPSATTLNVATTGSEGNDGSESRPFATLEQARDAIRVMAKARAGKLPPGGVRVVLAAGDYAVRRTFQLTADDSGTAGSPVVYASRPGATVRLRGGERIVNWRPVSDPAMKARLAPAVAGRVWEADLEPLGPRAWGDPTALRKRPELFVNGVPQVLARWPNQGFVKTGGILGTNTFQVWNSISGCKDGRFQFAEDRPRAWFDEPDVRLYGYWFWDWYEEYQTVASLDAEGKGFTLAEPYSVYGYRKGQRYYALNVFRELDQPGEWYLDRRAARVYWLPPDGVGVAEAEVILSVFDAPIIELKEARHVILQGLTLQEGRGDGIHVSGGADCLVAGCVVRRLGGDGVVLEGGRHHGVFGCRFETLGCGAMRVTGGDRKSLEPGRHFVENCTVTDISRLKRTYAPAVHLDGCGNRVAHNLFENMPSSALRIEGNDHLIELNLVRQVVQESDDQGALDMFGNPLYRGVVIRWNRWADIRGGTHNGAAGVRLDDMISGVVIHGNVFERCGAVIFGGVQIHGGKDNLVDGNLFLDCFAGVSFSRWGEKRWLEGIAGFLSQAGAPPYATRYPDLAAIKTGADINDLSRNLFVRSGPAFLRDGGKPRSALNGVIPGEVDEQLVAHGASLRAHPDFRPRLFEPIPLAEIGTYEHPWRVGPE